MKTTSTTEAVEAVAWERAPRYPGRQVNRRVVCADGFTVSIQASAMHYANDSHPASEGDEWPSADAPYWRGLDEEPTYPFTTFELGAVSEGVDLSALEEWDNEGVWAWVPRQVVADLLDSHGGAVDWEEPRAS